MVSPLLVFIAGFLVSVFAAVRPFPFLRRAIRRFVPPAHVPHGGHVSVVSFSNPPKGRNIRNANVKSHLLDHKNADFGHQIFKKQATNSQGEILVYSTVIIA